MPVYLPEGLLDQLTSLTVSRIFVCAHDEPFNLEYTDEEKVNHWAMYAQLEGDDFATKKSFASVRLDMGIGDGVAKTIPDGPLGLLTIQGLPLPMSDRTVKTCVVECDGVNLQTLISTVLDAGFDAYDFHPSAIGCRYWNKRVLEMLHDRKLVTTGVPEAISAMAKAWKSDGGEYSPCLPIRAGTFHNEA